MAPAAVAAYERGVAAFEARRFVEAAQAWRQAAALDPRLTDAYVGIGVVLLKQGRADEAEAAFQAALRQDPRQVNALANLGALAVQRGQYDIAVGYYRRAIGCDPTEASLWTDMAMSYLGADDLPAARAAVLNALAFDPDAQEARALLERIERQLAVSTR